MTASFSSSPQPSPLEAYAEAYQAREQVFLEDIESFGVPFAPERPSAGRRIVISELAKSGVRIENNGKSFVKGWLSPACEICRKGVGTATFLISVQCPRNCFFCFNPNQLDYDRLLSETNDVVAELEAAAARGVAFCDLALTGGEPLLHPEQTLAFFAAAGRLYPKAYTRLYTSGAGLNEALLAQLAARHLDEIRFSIKLDEGEAAVDKTLRLIALARILIPHVMVEMPVMPDQVSAMEKLLEELDELGVDGINLLELCFPLHNAAAFNERGYRLKRPPYQVLDNYWYAGGIPVDGSEEACLQLLKFAHDRGLSLGVHYCSLENKFTSQVYLSNAPAAATYPFCALSPTDHYLKSLKVFGADRTRVAAHLPVQASWWREDEEEAYLEMNPRAAADLPEECHDIEGLLAWYRAMPQEEGGGLAELAVERTTIGRIAQGEGLS